MRASTVGTATLFGPLLADRTLGRNAGRDHDEKCGLAPGRRIPCPSPTDSASAVRLLMDLHWGGSSRCWSRLPEARLSPPALSHRGSSETDAGARSGFPTRSTPSRGPPRISRSAAPTSSAMSSTPATPPNGRCVPASFSAKSPTASVPNGAATSSPMSGPSSILAAKTVSRSSNPSASGLMETLH